MNREHSQQPMLSSQDALEKRSWKKDPTVGFFWCLIGCHIALWTILPMLTQPNVPAETLELLSASQEISWGYPSQPPLAVWISAIVTSLTAPAVWPLYVLTQVCVAIGIWCAWKIARKFLHPWTALCSAVVLSGGYSFTVGSSAFTSSQLAGCFWSLSILAFYYALTKPQRRYWVATGICLGLGLLSNYGTFLLLIAIFTFTIWDSRARLCWDSSWPFLALLAMGFILLPHGIWLLNNDFVTIAQRFEASESVAHHLKYPIWFLIAQMMAIIPVLILLAPLVSWFSLSELSSTVEDDREFTRRYLLWTSCLPPAVIFALSLLAGPSSRLISGIPVWTYLGVTVLLWSHLEETRDSWRRVLMRTGTAAGVFAALLIVFNVMVPQLRPQERSAIFPGSQLAKEIQIAWKNAGHNGRIPVVAGPTQLVQNAGWYSQVEKAIDVSAPVYEAKKRGEEEAELRRKGGLVLWDARTASENTPQEISQKFGAVTILNPVNLKWQTHAAVPVLQVGMAIVHPENGEQQHVQQADAEVHQSAYSPYSQAVEFQQPIEQQQTIQTPQVPQYQYQYQFDMQSDAPPRDTLFSQPVQTPPVPTSPVQSAPAQQELPKTHQNSDWNSL